MSISILIAYDAKAFAGTRSLALDAKHSNAAGGVATRDGGSTCLPAEAREGGGVGLERLGEKLKRDFPLELGILGEEDFAPTALASSARLTPASGLISRLSNL